MIWPFRRIPPTPDPKAARLLSAEENVEAARRAIMTCDPGDLDALARGIGEFLTRSVEEAIRFDREQAWRRREEEDHKAKLCAAERRDHQDALDREAARKREEADAAPRAAALAAMRLARMKEIEQLREAKHLHFTNNCGCTFSDECRELIRAARVRIDALEALIL